MSDQAIILSGVAVSSLLIVGVAMLAGVQAGWPAFKVWVATLAIEYATVIAVIYFLARSRFVE